MMAAIHVVAADGHTYLVQNATGRRKMTAQDVIDHIKKTLPALAGEQFVVQRPTVEEGHAMNYRPSEEISEEKVLCVSKAVANETLVQVPTVAHRTVDVRPAPESMRQDVKDAGCIVNIAEFIDNAISALSQCLGRRFRGLVQVHCREEPGRGLVLTIEDNAVGMSKEVLEECMIMARSFAALPQLERDHKPLPVSQYINAHMNRFGRGIASFAYFGKQLEITTKEPGTPKTHRITANYGEWVAGPRDRQWQCEIAELNTVSTGWQPGFTCIKIWDLYEEARHELQEANWTSLAQRVSSLYYFHLSGIPDYLYLSLPDVVKDKRCKGYVTLQLFGQQVPSPNQDDRSLNTPLRLLLETAGQLHKPKHQPNLRNFVLLFRWVPEGKSIQQAPLVTPEGKRARRGDPSTEDYLSIDVNPGEDVNEYWRNLALGATGDAQPTPGQQGGTGGSQRRPLGTALHGQRQPSGPQPSTTGPSASRGKKRKEPPSAGDAAGPSNRGGVEVVLDDDEHVVAPLDLAYMDTIADTEPPFIDLMLVLMYFPSQNGKHTKPNVCKGLLPVWSGRVMPNDSLQDSLPEIVEAARKEALRRRVGGAHYLSRDHVGGLLLISPDCKAGRNKDSVNDPAIKEWMRLGSTDKKTTTYSRQDRGTWHVFNYGTGSFQPDPQGAFAIELLCSHYQKCWSKAEDGGHLVMPELSMKDNALVSATYAPPHACGYENMSKDELVTLDDKDVDGLSGGAAAGAAKGPKPCNTYVIVRFTQYASDQPVMVDLKRWMPPGGGPGAPRTCSVLLVRPLDKTIAARALKQAELVRQWQNTVPYQLAYKKAGVGNKGTRNESEAQGLNAWRLAGSKENLVPRGQLKQVDVVLADRACNVPNSAVRSGFQFTASNTKVVAELYVEKRGDYSMVWPTGKRKTEGCFPMDVNGSFCVCGFADSIQDLGHYRLVLKPEHGNGREQLPEYLPEVQNPDTGAVPELLYEFDVIEDAPGAAEVTMSWQSGVAPVIARVGVVLPPLVLRLSRGSRPQSWPLELKELGQKLKLVFGSDGRQDSDDEDDADGPVLFTGSTVQLSATGSAKLAWEAHDRRDAIVLSNVELKEKVLRDLGHGRSHVHTQMQAVFDMTSEAGGSGAGGAGPSSGRAAKRAATQQQRPGEPSLGRLTSTNTERIKVASGPPVQLMPGDGNTANLDITKGAYLPKDQTLRLVDQYGLPVYIRGAGSAGGAGPKRGGAASAVKPSARLELRGMQYRKGNRSATATEVVLQFDENGQLLLDEDAFLATGPMGSKASISVRVMRETFPEDARPPANLEYTFDIQVTQCQITFDHPALESNTGPSAHQAGVQQGRLLDLLPRVPQLQQYITGARTVLPDINSFNGKACDDIRDGLQDLMPGDPNSVAWVRPDGHVYRGPNWKTDIISLVQRVHQAVNLRVYQPVLVVGPACKVVEGINLTVCTYKEDRTDVTFSAPLKVIFDDGTPGGFNMYPDKTVGSKDLGHIPSRQTEKGYKLPPLRLDMEPVAAALADRHTLTFRVVDEDDPNSQYGSFYVRQAPRPAALHLLPSSPVLLVAGAGSAPTYTVTLPGCGCTSTNGQHCKPPKPLNKVSLRPPDWLATWASRAGTPAGDAGTSAAGTAGAGGALEPPTGKSLLSGWVADPWARDTEPLDLSQHRLQLDPGQVAHVRSGVPFEVHFMLVDQLGIPLVATQHMRDHISKEAMVAGTPSGAGKGRRAAAVAVEIKPGSWQWGVGKDTRINAVLLTVSTMGQADIRLNTPGLGAIHGALVTSDLILALTVVASSGPLARNGLRLAAPPATVGPAAPPPPQLETCSVDQLMDLNPAAAGAQGNGNEEADLATLIHDAIPEGDEARYMICQAVDGADHVLHVTLTDEHGFPVDSGRGGAGIALETLGTPVAAAECSRARQGSTIELTIKVARHTANLGSSPQLLLLRPPAPALPVIIALKLSPGHYPAAMQPVLADPGWKERINFESPLAPRATALPTRRPTIKDEQGEEAPLALFPQATEQQQQLPPLQVVLLNPAEEVWQQVAFGAPLPELKGYWEVDMREVGVAEADWQPLPGATEAMVAEWPQKGHAVIALAGLQPPGEAGMYRLRLTCAGVPDAYVGPIAVRQLHRLRCSPLQSEDTPGEAAPLHQRRKAAAPADAAGSSAPASDHHSIIHVTQPQRIQAVGEADVDKTTIEGFKVELLNYFNRVMPLPLHEFSVVLKRVQGPGVPEHVWMIHHSVKQEEDPSGPRAAAWTHPVMTLGGMGDFARPPPAPRFAIGEHYQLLVQSSLMASDLAGECAREMELWKQAKEGLPVVSLARLEVAQQDGVTQGWGLEPQLVAQWTITTASGLALRGLHAAAQAAVAAAEARHGAALAAQQALSQQVAEAARVVGESETEHAAHVQALQERYRGEEGARARMHELMDRLEDDGSAPRGHPGQHHAQPRQQNGHHHAYPQQNGHHQQQHDQPHQSGNPPGSHQQHQQQQQQQQQQDHHQNHLQQHPEVQEGNMQDNEEGRGVDRWQDKQLYLPRGHDMPQHNRPSTYYVRMMNFVLHNPVPQQLLGTLAMLLRCERASVAACLSHHIGFNPLNWIVQLSEVCEAAVDAAFADCKGLDYLTLNSPDVRDMYVPINLHHESLDHPQRLLRISEPQMGVDQLLNDSTRNPGNQAFKFVGYATNLVYLPPALLHTIRVRIPGRNESFSLRQSLVWRCFKQLMVFEDFTSMQRFADQLRSLHPAQRLERNTRMVSLDGGAINMTPGVKSKLHPISDRGLRLSGVSRMEQLDMPHTLDRMLQPVQAEILQLRQLLSHGVARARDLETARAALLEVQERAEAEAPALLLELEQAKGQLVEAQEKEKQLRRQLAHAPQH